MGSIVAIGIVVGAFCFAVMIYAAAEWKDKHPAMREKKDRSE